MILSYRVESGNMCKQNATEIVY